MPEYIEREKAYELARTSELYSDFHRSMADLTSLKELLEDTPTADVVEVVRCRNCKHGQYAYLNGQKIATGVTCEYDQDRIKPFNHFCGNGERKDVNNAEQ